MNFFQRLIRKPAVLMVTLWARHAYNMGVEAAEKRHAKEHCTIYLAEDSFKPGRLVTYNKLQFKTEKRVYGVSARLLTMNTLRSGSYYYTKDVLEQNGISKHDAIVRRKAFVKERLRKACLV